MVHAHAHRRHALKNVAAAAVQAVEEVKREAAPAQTYVSVVYVTAEPTFDGPVGGYVTVGQGDNQINAAEVAPTPTPTPTPAPAPAPAPAPPKSVSSVFEASVVNTKKASSQSQLAAAPQTTLQTSARLPSSIVSVSTSLDSDLPLLAATAPTSTTASTRASSGTLSAASETSTSTSKTTDGGMGTGGKVGLAIGLVLIIGTVVALCLFFVKRRRNADKKGEALRDEKDSIFGGPERAASTRTTATAPRLSLRPVTQFIPNFGERRQSRGNALTVAANQAPHQNEKPSAWERPMGGQDANRNNPFGSHAETIDPVNANGPAVVGDATTSADALLNAGTIGLARGASKRGVKPLDLTRSGPFMGSMGPPSPSGTEFSMTSEGPSTPVQTTSSAAIAAAGGPANSAVHRVQLDFKPSMDDELELHAGQLIRMLHEYDDGWALCIRLDRSRQGVVPRTCLSTRPVKPRPQQGPPRGSPPAGMRVPQQGRPQSPSMRTGPLPLTPNGNQARPMTPTGAPMTPTGTGPQYKPSTPNGQNRSRSNSSSTMSDRRNSPPGPSPMNPGERPAGPPPAAVGAVARKPVGQAM